MRLHGDQGLFWKREHVRKHCQSVVVPGGIAFDARRARRAGQAHGPAVGMRRGGHDRSAASRAGRWRGRSAIRGSDAHRVSPRTGARSRASARATASERASSCSTPPACAARRPRRSGNRSQTTAPRFLRRRSTRKLPPRRASASSGIRCALRQGAAIQSGRRLWSWVRPAPSGRGRCGPPSPPAGGWWPLTSAAAGWGRSAPCTPTPTSWFERRRSRMTRTPSDLPRCCAATTGHSRASSMRCLSAQVGPPHRSPVRRAARDPRR